MSQQSCAFHSHRKASPHFLAPTRLAHKSQRNTLVERVISRRRSNQNNTKDFSLVRLRVDISASFHFGKAIAWSERDGEHSRVTSARHSTATQCARERIHAASASNTELSCMRQTIFTFPTRQRGPFAWHRRARISVEVRAPLPLHANELAASAQSLIYTQTVQSCFG